jgi:hypothetical protein
MGQACCSQDKETNDEYIQNTIQSCQLRPEPITRQSLATDLSKSSDQEVKHAYEYKFALIDDEIK